VLQGLVSAHAGQKSSRLTLLAKWGFKQLRLFGIPAVTFRFVNILEAPNNETVAKVAIKLGARGTLQTLTMAALSLGSFIKALKSG